MVPGARTARTHGMALTVTLWLRFPSPALLFRRFHDICFSLHGSVGCVVSVSQGPPLLRCIALITGVLSVRHGLWLIWLL